MLKELFRVDYVSKRGSAHNYAINLSRREALMMAESLLIDKGYADDGELADSVTIKRQGSVQ